MHEYDIRAPGRQTRARPSGGNQQKVVVARELARKPAALINPPGASIPARRASFWSRFGVAGSRRRDRLFSSELEEVLDISDRIAVMANRRFAGVMNRAEADIKTIGLWMSGRAA